MVFWVIIDSSLRLIFCNTLNFKGAKDFKKIVKDRQRSERLEDSTYDFHVNLIVLHYFTQISLFFSFKVIMATIVVGLTFLYSNLKSRRTFSASIAQNSAE